MIALRYIKRSGGHELRDDRIAPQSRCGQFRDYGFGGRTGHAEVVRVTFDPAKVTFRDVLNVFFTIHDPTTRNRQGNDVGTQYRSAIYVADAEQRKAAELSKQQFQERLKAAGFGQVTTEIRDAPPFYYAEGYHQQYLAKNPDGYCPDHSCGVRFDSAGLQVGEKA